jgi:hypothetical protein
MALYDAPLDGSMNRKLGRAVRRRSNAINDLAPAAGSSAIVWEMWIALLLSFQFLRLTFEGIAMPLGPSMTKDCNFYRYTSEQRTITKRYRRMADRRKISLLTRLREDEQTGAVRLTPRNFGRTRGALATLLMQLIDDAGLNHLAFGAVAAPTDANPPKYCVKPAGYFRLVPTTALWLSGPSCSCRR